MPGRPKGKAPLQHLFFMHDKSSLAVRGAPCARRRDTANDLGFGSGPPPARRCANASHERRHSWNRFSLPKLANIRRRGAEGDDHPFWLVVEVEGMSGLEDKA